MNRILHYGRHLFHAKGRHGTHSPFVYAFVEQVMRSRISAPAAVPEPFRKREAALLYRSIRYLAPQDIYAAAAFMPLLDTLLSEISIPCRLHALPASGIQLPDSSASLVITDTVKWSAENRAALPGTGRSAVLCFLPHRNKAAYAHWQALAADPSVQVSLDYWYWGLLVKDAAFKAKQHFRLR